MIKPSSFTKCLTRGNLIEYLSYKGILVRRPFLYNDTCILCHHILQETLIILQNTKLLYRLVDKVIYSVPKYLETKYRTHINQLKVA